MVYTTVLGRNFLDNLSLGFESGFVIEETHLNGLAGTNSGASKSCSNRGSFLIP